MQFSYLQFEHPNNLRTSDELSRLNFWVDRLQKKNRHETSSEVCKMLGCSNRKYENCIFICRRLHSNVLLLAEYECPSPGIHEDTQSCDSYFVCVLAGKSTIRYHQVNQS